MSFTCYTPDCGTDVSEPFTVCSKCSAALYPTKMDTTSYWQERFKELAKSAPQSVDTPDYRSPFVKQMAAVQEALL